MSLIPQKLMAELLANGQYTKDNEGNSRDPKPVLKLFTPDANATWLLTEADPDEPDRLYGLCDLGLGEPELGYVSLREIMSVRGSLRLPVERDLHFVGKHPLSHYATLARQRGTLAGI